MAARPFETVTLDVGFGPPSAFAPEGLGTSDLLAFAGIEPLTVPALPLPEHVAEKIHAYTRTYGAQGLSGTGVSSTRVKDLIDLALIASTASLPTHFRADDLRRALVATFAARATHMLQVSLPAPPAGWAAPYAKLAAEVGIDPEVLAGHRLVAGFLDPVLSGAAAGKHWDPATQTWEADA